MAPPRTGMTETAAGEKVRRLAHGTAGEGSGLLQGVIPATALRSSQPLAHISRDEISKKALVELRQAMRTGHAALGGAAALPGSGGAHFARRAIARYAVECTVNI